MNEALNDARRGDGVIGHGPEDARHLTPIAPTGQDETRYLTGYPASVDRLMERVDLNCPASDNQSKPERSRRAPEPTPGNRP